MGDSSITVQNHGLMGTSSRTYEANSQPLDTKTLGLVNFDSGNDFSVPLQADDGTKVYLRPDQIDGIRMRALGGRLDEGGSITIQVNGSSHTVSGQSLQTQLAGRGALT